MHAFHLLNINILRFAIVFPSKMKQMLMNAECRLLFTCR